MLNEQRISAHLTISGRPDDAEFADLKSRGFGTVINLVTPEEPGFGTEERLVQEAGLSYASIPVAPPLLDDLAASRFLQEVKSSREPVLVHCKGGGRAGVMSLLYLAIEHGWTVEQALAEGHALHLKLEENSPYRPFFTDYLKRHSAGERARAIDPEDEAPRPAEDDSEAG